MPAELLANVAESTVADAGGITSTATSVTVATGDGARFPAASSTAGQFRAAFVDSSNNVLEYVTVTNRSTDTLTIVRESEDATRFPKAARAQGTKIVQVLTKNALTEWLANSAAQPGFRSGAYYGPWGTVNTWVANNGDMRSCYLIVPKTTTFNRIGVEVTAAGTVTVSLVRLGIYADDGGRLGARVLDAGTVASDSTGFKEITISQSLDPGLYWLVAVAQGGAVTSPTLRAVSGPFGAGTTSGTALNRVGYLHTGITGALPATASTTYSDNVVAPLVSLRAA